MPAANIPSNAAVVSVTDSGAPRVDTKAVASLKAELEELRATTVSKDSYDQLRRELNDVKKALDMFKSDSLEQFRNLRREVSEQDVMLNSVLL